MRHGILTLDQKDIWKKYLQMMPAACQDIYFEPDYYGLYQTPRREAQCFFVEDGGQVLLYPFLKTHINRIADFKLEKDCYDIEGAYGYNGIAVSSDRDDFVRKCAGIFARHCGQERIVAEFMRLNPMLPMPAADSWWDLKPVNINVFVDLTLSEEELWKNSYEHCVRKNVNKARQEGISIKSYTGRQMDENLLKAFIGIYNHTMQRNNSDGGYYFSEKYFQDICVLLPENSLFFFACLHDKPVSCELVLKGKKNAYSFLGGTLAEAQQQRPNNLLKHELILCLKALNLEKYILGGGKARGDSIYKYKHTFAKHGDMDFSIAYKVHDRNIYDGLVSQWEERFPEKKMQYGNYFLKYHY